MSTIVKTDAVVLKTMKYLESSKIVTYYTQRFGKVTGIVKGARRFKSKYGLALEPMSYVSVEFYKKEGREIQTVSLCESIKSLESLTNNLDKMAIGIAIIEIINKVSQYQEQNKPKFALLVNSLTVLNDATQNLSNLLYYFEIHLAKIMGFGISIDRCVECDKILKEIVEGRVYNFKVERGGLICASCFKLVDRIYPLSAGALKILRAFQTSNELESIFRVEVDNNVGNIIDDFLWVYLQYHVAGLRSLKSRKVFSKILS